MARVVRSTLVDPNGLPVAFDADAVLGVRALPPLMARVIAGDGCFVDLPYGHLYQLGESAESVIAKVWPAGEPG